MVYDIFGNLEIIYIDFFGILIIFGYYVISIKVYYGGG